MTILETSRLRLRELTLEDVDELHAVLGDPEAMVHYPKPFDREMTIGWIEWSRRNYERHGFGLWGVIDKETERLVGDCGLTFQVVDDVAELEIGYRVRRDLWGRGLATEAAVACRDHVFDKLGKVRVISWMHPDNVASRRVAEKVGMTLEKQSKDRHGRPAVVYSMTPEDRNG